RANLGVCLGSKSRGAGQHGLEFEERGLQAVHFPVAGNQRPDSVAHIAISSGGICPSMRYQSVAATSRCRACDAAFFNANGLSAKVARGPPPLYDALSIR